ncbi:hypothetical protein QTP88_024196 [Uroleucon formosanum]
MVEWDVEVPTTGQTFSPSSSLARARGPDKVARVHKSTITGPSRKPTVFRVKAFENCDKYAIYTQFCSSVYQAGTRRETHTGIALCWHADRYL